MNEEQRIQYWKEYAATQGKLERRFYSVIKKVLRNQISSFTDRLSRGVVLDSDYQRVKGTEMALVLATLHVYSAIVWGSKVYKREKNKKAGNMGYNERWTKEVLRYFAEHNGKYIKNITETTREQIRQVLSEGVKKGYGAEKLVRMLKSSGLTRARALRIVRTETVRATNYGNFLAADELGIEVDKQWISTHDTRVRDSHKYLDGEVAMMEERFINGCLYPGDPDAAAKETINCRCTLGFVPKRDRQGNLIERPQEQPPAIEFETEESVSDLFLQILRGSVIGFLITDLLSVDNSIKTFVKEIFKGIGMLNVISDLFD